MLSSLSRFGGKDRQHGDRSPFSSPYSVVNSTPIVARRSLLEERRRPAADFDRDLTPAPASRIDEEDEDGEEVIEHDGKSEEEEDNDNDDEDGAEETSPLLPIFSAAHLGELALFRFLPYPLTMTSGSRRFSSCL